MSQPAFTLTETTESFFGKEPVIVMEFEVPLRIAECGTLVKSRLYLRASPNMPTNLRVASQRAVSEFSERAIRDHFRPWFSGNQLHPIAMKAEQTFRKRMALHCERLGYTFLMFQNMGYAH